MNTFKDTVMMELMTPPRQFLSLLTRSFAVRVYDAYSYDFVKAGNIQNIRVDKGKLFIDDRAIPNARFGSDFISFNAQDSKISLSGILNFTPDWQAISGTIYKGPLSGDAESILVAGVAPVTTYNTEIGFSGSVPKQNERFPAWSPASPSKWEKSLIFSQSYTFNNGQLPTPVYKINNQDVSIYSDVSINPKTGNSLVTISIPPSILSEYIEQMGVDAPASFIIEISESGTSFLGNAQRAVRTATGDYTLSTEYYQYRGKWNRAPSKFPDSNQKTSTSGVKEEEMVAVSAGSMLGITKLYTMQVDPKQLQQNQFHELIKNMKWALGQDPKQKKLLDFFGELPPDLTKSRTTVIKKDLDFYANEMATSYLGGPINRMKGPGAPTTRLTKTQETDLSFYLQAGLPKNPGFTRQSNGVFLNAFTETADGLIDYINDQKAHTSNGKINPGHDWGAQLLQELTTPIRLNMVYNNVAQGFGMSNFNRHTALLMALDSSGAYAKKYHKAFLSRSLGESVKHLDLSSKTATSKWLTLAINALITNCKINKRKFGVDDYTQKQIEKLAEELSDASDRLGGVTALANALADLVIAAQMAHGDNDFWGILQAAQTKFGQAGYVFARAIFVLAIIGGVVASIISFLNWNKLSKEAQGETVTAAVESAAKVISTIKEIWNGEWNFESSGQLDMGFADIELTEPLLGNMENIGEAADKTASILEGGNLADSSWGEIFSSFDGILSIIGAAAAAVFAVLSTITFIDDILNHASVGDTVLDGIIAAANIGVAIAGVVVFFSASMAVPILGAVAAVIGVIASLIELLIPKPKPKTPAELFMENNLLPAINGPNAWIKPSPPLWMPGNSVPLINPYSHKTT